MAFRITFFTRWEKRPRREVGSVGSSDGILLEIHFLGYLVIKNRALLVLIVGTTNTTSSILLLGDEKNVLLIVQEGDEWWQK